MRQGATKIGGHEEDKREDPQEVESERRRSTVLPSRRWGGCSGNGRSHRSEDDVVRLGSPLKVSFLGASGTLFHSGAKRELIAVAS